MLLDASFKVGTIARDKTAALPGRGNLAWLPSTRPGHLALIHTCEREEIIWFF